eukprot:TRINITY_DN8156_c0_g1_i2.p1 TRINITY_DN8156_c0_g1~~TRINITY_DN8156_c0_g1_i2.p1  ORF type:complete len:1763 (+),score=358.35 TRINITY_DN8156_c0_g1_i2:99-5387(+)
MGTNLLVYEVDSTTNCYDLTRVVANATYDPRGRGWYIAAKASGSPGWGDGVYADFTTGNLVISSTHPMYMLDSSTGKPSTTLIGVGIADCELKAISSQLSQLPWGKTGEAYVIEYVVNASNGKHEFMVGQSDGIVFDRTTGLRLSPDEASSSVIKDSYKYLNENYQVAGTYGGTKIDSKRVTVTGDVIAGTGMVAMTPFTDTTGTLAWQAIVAIPIDDYYSFIIECMVITAVLTIVMVCLCVRMIVLPYRFSKKNKIITDAVGEKLSGQLMRCILGCIAVGVVLWVLWLVYTKLETDVAVKQTLNATVSYTAANLTWRWEEYPLIDYETIMAYTIGALPLGTVPAVDGSNGLALDKHLTNRLQVSGTMAGIFIGFANGDLVGMQYECKYNSSSTCTNNTYQTSVLRSAAATNSSYYTYNTTSDTSGTSYVRDTTKVRSVGSIYSATGRPWYLLALKQAKLTNPRYGSPVVTAVYLLEETVLISIAQAFYDSSGNSVGVVEVDVDYLFLSNLLKSSLPSEESQSALVQNLGEMLASSDLVTQLPSSDGGFGRLNVTNSPMARIQAFGIEIYAINGSLSDGQNDTTLHGEFIEVGNSAATYETPYTFLAEKLETWTLLLTYEREIYFGDLDTGTEKNFVIIVFAFTAVGYISSKLVGMSIAHMAKEQKKLMKKYNFVPKTKEELMREKAVEHATGLVMTLTKASPEVMAQSMALMKDATELEAEISEHCRYREALSPGEIDILALSVRLDKTAAMKLSKLDHAGEDPDARMVLFYFLEAHLERMIEKWKVDPNDIVAMDAKLKAKAVELVKIAEKGLPVLPALTIEATFGEGSRQYQMYRFANASATRMVLYIFMLVFIASAFFRDRTAKSTMSFLCLIPYTMDTAFLAYIDHYTDHPRMSKETLIPIIMNVVLWTTTLITASSSSLAEERGVVLLEDFFRPWMLLAKSAELTDALKLLGKCLFEARNIFFYLFTVVAISAIMVNLIFYKKFDVDNGETVDTFLEAFVYMFIFLTSGENWDVLVYQGYRAGTSSSLLWVLLSMFGIFALMSMVIATFETTYSMFRYELDMFRIANEAIANHVAFQCLSWHLPLQKATEALKEEENCTDFYKELANSRLEDFVHDFMGVDHFDVDERINPLLLLPGATKGQNYANPAQMDHARSIQAALKVMTVLQDVDDNLSVTLEEFADALIAAKCAKCLRHDVLLASEAMVLRAAVLMNATQKALESCPPWERAMKARLGVVLENQERRMKEVSKVHKKTEAVVKDMVGITPKFSLDQLDVVMVIAMLFHGFWLSLWGSANQDLIKSIGVLFAVIYVAEVGLRVWCVGGLHAFANDRRGTNYQFQNVFMLCLAIIGTSAQVLFYVLPSMYGPLCQGLAALQLWRILAVAANFRQITHSFFLGLKPVQLFIVLLLLVMFTYSVLAHYFFHHVENEDGTLAFTSLFDSVLAMHQVFIGEGWHGVMDEAVGKTNKALIWFFASYVLLVGVLFSNLFVGILLNMFQMGERLAAKPGGRVELALSAFCPDYEEESDELNTLLLNMGHVAEVMHFPAEFFHEHVTTQFKDQIDQRQGILDWASHLIVQGFHRIMRNKRQEQLHGFEATVPKGFTTFAIRAAILDGHRQNGMHSAHPITRDETLTSIIQMGCERLGLSKKYTTYIMERLLGRRQSYLRLFQQKKLSKEAAAQYDGIADPQKVPLEFTGVLLVFYQLLFACLEHYGEMKPSSDAIRRAASEGMNTTSEPEGVEPPTEKPPPKKLGGFKKV